MRETYYFQLKKWIQGNDAVLRAFLTWKKTATNRNKMRFQMSYNDIVNKLSNSG